MTIQKARQQAFQELQQAHQKIKTPFLDIDVLLSELLKKDRAWILAHREQFLSKQEKKIFFEQIKKRKNGKPIAYLTQKKEFFNLPFFINESVLIPKPDTELLVKKAIDFLLTQKNNMPVFLDFCTGSGCVAIAILHEICKYNMYPQAFLYDIDEQALNIAKKNAYTLLPKSVFNSMRFIKTNILISVPFPKNQQSSCLITANPPYIPTKIAQKLLKDGRSEPLHALDGGKDGTNFIAPIAKHAAALLQNNGKIFIEIDETQAKIIQKIFTEHKLSAQVHMDIANKPRVVEGALLDKNARIN